MTVALSLVEPRVLELPLENESFVLNLKNAYNLINDSLRIPSFPQSVWVKKGTMQWWRDWKPHKWVDVQFALEQFSGAEGNKDGILFIYYTFNDEKKVISHPILWLLICVN